MPSSNRETPVYQIVVSDSASDLYSFGVPAAADTPHTLYSSMGAAKDALLEFVRKFEKFIPVAYGDAYPYENISFETYLQEKGFAPFGWTILNDEDNHPLRVGIFLLALTINH
jgi:hypothetical protein